MLHKALTDVRIYAAADHYRRSRYIIVSGSSDEGWVGGITGDEIREIWEGAVSSFSDFLPSSP